MVILTLNPILWTSPTLAEFFLNSLQEKNMFGDIQKCHWIVQFLSPIIFGDMEPTCHCINDTKSQAWQYCELVAEGVFQWQNMVPPKGVVAEGTVASNIVTDNQHKSDNPICHQNYPSVTMFSDVISQAQVFFLGKYPSTVFSLAYNFSSEQFHSQIHKIILQSKSSLYKPNIQMLNIHRPRSLS